MASKTTLENEFRDIFHALMHGTQQETREAKRRLERLWRKDSKAFQRAAPVALEYLGQFDSITQTANQAAFASALRLFFLVLSDEHFELLKDFVLKAIQHPNGHVRESVRKTADWLYISLSARTDPFVYPADKPLNSQQKAEQQQAITQYQTYAEEIQYLIEKNDDGSEPPQGYIDEMKPSVHKSLQLLWSEVTRGNFGHILHNPPPDIREKQKKIENALEYYLQETQSEFELNDIKDIIYHEQDTGAFKDLIAIFDTGRGTIDLQELIYVINDAWNYFPHQILNELSPTEKLRAYRQQQGMDIYPDGPS